jgi:hypothetical protein
VGWHALRFITHSELMRNFRILLRFDGRDGHRARGFAFSLHTSVWGTNFRMWFDGGCSSRLVLASRYRFRPHSQEIRSQPRGLNHA